MTARAATLVSSSTTLVDLVRRRARREEIAAYLDDLSHAARLEAVIAVGGSLVGRLYDAVGGGPALTLDDFVPPGETGTVIFEGKNSLPAFTRFQKRFARVGDTVVGYNHQLMAFATGPGYFLVRPPTAGEAHPDELFFDYTGEPSAFPPGWPAFKPNSLGLSRAVYMNMKDFCRPVAKGVLVGKAYKLGVSQNAYFTLTKPY
ncbi:MAG TPA: hypothetical protein VL400_24400 [Polyangiaceae bacterium]|nr:hypothetical protein [Polyangiaceae bacterium]